MWSVKQSAQITFDPGIGYLLAILVAGIAGDRSATIGGFVTLWMFETVVVCGTRDPANTQHHGDRIALVDPLYWRL